VIHDASEELPLAARARILVFEGAEPIPSHYLDGSGEAWEVVRVRSVQEGVARLQTEHFDGIYASTQDPKVWQRTWSLLQTDAILEVLDQGVAALQPDFRILWANATFEKWCGGPVKGRLFQEALGCDSPPCHNALLGKPITTRLQRPDGQTLELRLLPVKDAAGEVRELIALCRDVTAEASRQRKLDRLHQAGRELAALSADQLADMDVHERVAVLKENIRKLTHDLLQYDVIEIRLLDPTTGRLEPLLAEGMTPEAASRELYAKEQDNGVTGYVAATGKSYVCTDTATDPHYIEGAAGARSSLTVALTWGDNSKVIGTFNVESPQVGAFGDEDLQFAEIFCRELANALHTLQLLVVEQQTATTRSIEAINRQVALPVDEILAAATSILDHWIGHDPEVADKLRKVIANARLIKHNIQKVGQDMAPGPRPLSFPGLEAPSRLRGKHVLVVDNDDRVRRSAHDILGRMGCVVETARDGKEAQTMAKLSDYDAMLADIRLPDLSGYEVFRALREAQPTARVILMTGYGYDPSHSIVKARQDGLRFVLYKPFRVEQLVSALESPEGPPQPAL
jgi:CheY-like chemotaxis protein/putative methionine-R-sulfoxide reductase with GAF domain/PAS domain-containing protein